MFQQRAIPTVPIRGALTDVDQDVLRFVLESPGRVVLVTLVEIRGGSSRALGAQMAVREDGVFCGYVSGGCTEAAVAGEALESLSQGHDRLLRLGAGSPFFDIVLPCGGGITLALHLVRDMQPIAMVMELLASRRPATLSYNSATPSLAVSEVTEEGWQDGVFHRRYRPTRRLAVAGSGVEAAVTRQMAEAAGYEIVALSAEHLDEETAVVLLMHDVDRELPLLEAALAGRSRYIGALGSSTTHHRRCEALRRRGHGEDAIARIKGPIGLFGPARDAATLAVSVLADIAK